MKITYVKPMTAIHAVIPENFICNNSDRHTTDSASFGKNGSPNENNQGNIDTGGPGIAGSKENPFTEEYTNNIWED